MPSDNDKSESSFQEELVPVVFDRSVEEAEQYRQLLEDHDIEAIIDAPDGEELRLRFNSKTGEIISSQSRRDFR